MVVDSATYAGTTAFSAWSGSPGCLGARDDTGAEVFYRLVSPVSRTVRVTLTPHGADLDLIALGADADGGCALATGCLAASQTPGVGQVETVEIDAVTGETYFLAVDGYAAARGAYTLAVDCAEAPAPPPSGCTPAPPIVCGGSAAGNSAAGASQVDGWCGVTGESGPEVYHAFTAAVSGPVTATLSGMTADLDLFVIGATAGGECDPAVCLGYGFTTGTEVVTFDAVAGQTYYFIVEGYAGASDAYQLALTCP